MRIPKRKRCIRLSAIRKRTQRLGRISISSPIARALIGKSEGETIEVNAPGGARSYEIIGFRFLWTSCRSP